MDPEESMTFDRIFTSIQSLEHAAAVTLAISLSSNTTIKTIMQDLRLTDTTIHASTGIYKFYHDESVQNGLRTINFFIMKLLGVHLPEKLSGIIFNAFELIFKEIFDWALYNDVYVLQVEGTSNINCKTMKSIFLIDHIKWQNNIGLIDFEATARSLVNSGDLNDREKFFIISTYCLEDMCNSTFLSDFALQYTTTRTDCYFNGLPYYWSSVLNNSLVELEERYPWSNIHEFHFEHSAEYGHLNAMSFFWRKISRAKKIKHIPDLVLEYGLRVPFVWDFIIHELNVQERRNIFSFRVSIGLFLPTILGDVYWRHCFVALGIYCFGSYSFYDYFTLYALFNYAPRNSNCMCPWVNLLPVLLDYWNSASEKLKCDLIEQDRGFLTIVLHHLHKHGAIDTISLFFSNLDNNFVKKYLSSNEAKDVFKDLVLNGYKNKVRNFLCQKLTGEETSKLILEIENSIPSGTEDL